ncbi:ATP-dependent RNA helicase dbp6 [Microbotryomycetes sp. JL201]|nr:ATP-dependent RNA helicase dbp6 [Microbotryomycetes sp. JL201]
MSKRTASDAFQDSSVASNSAVPEWKPQGEDPAEREKRIKREKRALRLQQLEQQQSSHQHEPSQPPSYAPTGAGRQERWTSGREVAEQPTVPSTTKVEQPAAPESVADSDVNKKGKHAQSKTPARLKYLQRKKVRAKAKKASTPKDKTTVATMTTSENGDKESDEDDERHDDLDEEARAEKQRIIEQKKAERKRKRDEKKQEIKRLKAEGWSKTQIEEHFAKLVHREPNASAASPAPRHPSPEKITAFQPIAAKPTSPAKPKQPLPPSASIDEQDEEAKKAAAEEAAARLARKEAKRMKRETRKSKAVEAELAKVEAELNGQENVEADDDVDMQSADETEVEPRQQEEEEPAPLLRLPGASRPQPPSRKVLRNLNIHESVKNKQVVDPDLKIAIDDETLGLSDRGRKKLKDMAVHDAFAVQTATFPLLLVQSPSTVYTPFEPIRDICVSAPTGSGKTLSYVVPIVEILSSRVVTRLRALILLPTRDLVTQIGVATGQHSFSHEQAALVNNATSHEGGSSLVDILIATPGRLIDHLRSTPGFSLQHLRYLVVDEADRLLTQSFHDWLPAILNGLKPTRAAAASDQSSVLAPDWLEAERADQRTELGLCQKLLFSATLSRDSAKIDALQLNRPIYISVEDRLDPNAEDDDLIDGELKFTLPSQLQEHMIISESAHKPLYLFHLLHTLSLSSALCFTKSVEAATRLAKLVEFFEQALSEQASDTKASFVVVKAYSSELAPSERQKILSSFKKGEVQMLICSDLIARGIDLPHVSHVISYDIPSDMRKYVHRVGRTARAGKHGDAWSLVEDQEVAPFRSIMKNAQHWDKIKRVRVKENAVEPFVTAYQVALGKLRAYFATS